MNIHDLYGFVFRSFRPARLRRLYRTLRLSADTRVLDIGGSASLWLMAGRQGLPLPRLTVVNLNVARDAALPQAGWVCGDALALPFADAAFDVAVSNSVVEHVGGWEAQQRFAREVHRVARSYFVQTPDAWFPVEPHLLTPLVHWFPRAWAGGLLRHFTVWGWVTRPGRAECRRFWDGLHLLTYRQMRVLFPGARLIRERLLGWSKSIVAVGPVPR